MKRYQFFHALIFSMLVLFSACKKDEAKQQEENNPYTPRIFDINRVMAAPQIINEGQTANFTGLLFSPANQVKVSWKVNDKEVSTDTAFKFKPVGGGEFTVKLDVSYGGQTTSRQTKVLVSPGTYTFKPYAKVVMAELTEDGTAADLVWSNITHVTYQIGKVAASGTLDLSKGNVNHAADELVARAHINGVPVILGLSGRLSGIDGWAIYESNDFGTAIKDPVKMQALVQTVKKYLSDRKMDGVDINMTDINSDAADANITAIGPFLSALKSALPSTAIITVTATVNYHHWAYTDLSAASWVNIHAYEDNAHIGPDAPVGQSSSYDFMVSSAKIWTDFHLAANKIVVGMPAFGLRYDALNAAGNNLSWGSYGYITYKDILKADPTAFNKEKADIALGVYFNGVPLVTKKSGYLKTAGFKGAYLWAADYDGTGAGSLMAAIYKTLN